MSNKIICITTILTLIIINCIFWYAQQHINIDTNKKYIYINDRINSVWAEIYAAQIKIKENANSLSVLTDRIQILQTDINNLDAKILANKIYLEKLIQDTKCKCPINKHQYCQKHK